MAQSPAPHWAAKSARLYGVACLLALCVLALVIMAASVWRELVTFDQMKSDNTQWALMQTEVELLRLELSVTEAAGEDEPADLAELRSWFDVVYARAALLEQSEAYAEKLRLPEYSADAARLRSFLDRTVPLIDGPDSELRASLSTLAGMLPDIRQGARKMALRARSEAATATGARQQEVKWTLLKLALLTAVLLIIPSGLTLFLLRIMRLGRLQTKTGALTSARLQTIFATSADAIIVTNRGGWIVDINPAAEAMFGHSREAALGVHALALLVPPELVDAQSKVITTTLDASAARAKGMEKGPLRIELVGKRADGARLPVEVSVGAMQVESGGVIVALVRDISDRQMAQTALTDALLLAQAGDRAKADFIAVMSHEMRTPLNGLLGSLELLGATDMHAKQKDLVNVIGASGQILLHHVNSVLDISKAEADRGPELQIEFDFDQLIADCIANQAGLAVTKGLMLSAQAPGGPIGKVKGDPVRVQQILLNLIGNAVKFTAKGRVFVEAERLGPEQPVEIRVIDTGSGISEFDLDRVFDDFFTLDTRYDRPAEGSGLGLGIARRIVLAMGGEIGVESVLGDGSLFWLRLPLPQVEDHAPAPVKLAAFPTAAQFRVLVIEDNPVNRFVLRRLLEETGHSVTEANNGVDGVKAAIAEGFDVIMTDISMPGLDGVEVARQIRALDGPSQRARVIAVTAHAMTADLQRFRAAGIDDCLTKPITRLGLAAALGGATAPEPPLRDAPILDKSQIADLNTSLGSTATVALILRVIAEGDAAETDTAWLADVSGKSRLHALAGSAGTFGARALQLRLAMLHDACAADDSASAALFSVGISELWHETRKAFLQEVALLQADQPKVAAGA